MLGSGEAIPEVEVWTAPRERAAIRTLAEGGPALLVFYLFDWSST